MCWRNAIRVAGPNTGRDRHAFDCGLGHAVLSFVAITPFTRNQWEAWVGNTRMRSYRSCRPVAEGTTSEVLPSNCPGGVVYKRPSSDRFKIVGNLRASVFAMPCRRSGTAEVSANSF